MSSDLDYRTRCRLEQIKQSREAQEFYDEQQRIYKRNKLKRDLEHEEEMNRIRNAHKSKVAMEALDEIHILSDRIRELEEIIKKATNG